jgi:hypothetical protein
MEAVFLFMVVGVGAPALKDRPAPPPIVGEWEAEGFTSAKNEAVATGTFADPRPRWTFTADGRVLEGGRLAGRFKLDLKASPATIAWSRPGPEAADPPAADLTGTFRVEGDLLTLTLTTGPGGDNSTLTYRRVNKE